MAMAGTASPLSHKPAGLLESTVHGRCPGRGARSCLGKQGGMPRPEGHLQAEAGQHSGQKEVNRDERCCAVNGALRAPSFRPPDLRHVEGSASPDRGVSADCPFASAGWPSEAGPRLCNTG